MNETLTIKFGVSRTLSSQMALSAAAIFDSIEISEHGAVKTCTVEFCSDEIARAMPLLAALRHTRNKHSFVDGVEREWSSVFGFLQCYLKRQSARSPQLYCFGSEEAPKGYHNTFGCFFNSLPYQDIWECGEVRNGRWYFDKCGIEEKINVTLHSARHCPGLKYSQIEHILTSLPESIIPSVDNGWMWKEEFCPLPGLKTWRVRLLKKRERSIIVSGVRPVSIPS